MLSVKRVEMTCPSKAVTDSPCTWMVINFMKIDSLATCAVRLSRNGIRGAKMEGVNDMARYIDLDQAIKAAIGALHGVSHITAVEVAQALEDLPAIDVVENAEAEA